MTTPESADAAFDSIRRSGQLFLTVRGASMAPELWPGDLLLARPRNFDDVLPGEIVVFAQDERLIAHRVVSRAGAGVVTRGDAAQRADAPVRSAAFLGVVDRVMRGNRAFAPRRYPPVHSRVLAALLRRSYAASRIAQRMRAFGGSGAFGGRA